MEGYAALIGFVVLDMTFMRSFLDVFIDGRFFQLLTSLSKKCFYELRSVVPYVVLAESLTNVANEMPSIQGGKLSINVDTFCWKIFRIFYPFKHFLT